MSALELVYDFFEDHVRATAVVNERKPLAFAMLCLFLSALSLFTVQALTQRLHLLSFSWPSFAIALLWKFTAAFLLVAVVHLILDMQGRYGSPSTLFVLFSLADLAWAVALPLALVLRAVTRSGLAVSAAFVAIGLLTLSLKARSIQDNYHVSSGRAWMAIGLPYVGVLLGAVMAFSLALVGMVTRLLQSLH